MLLHCDSYRQLLTDLPVTIVSMAYQLDDETDDTSDEMIVNKCITAIDSCNIFLLDCSIKNWIYIGCIFELAHAYSMRKPIITYIGENNEIDRPWLRHHSGVITTTKQDAHGAISQIVGKLL